MLLPLDLIDGLACPPKMLPFLTLQLGTLPAQGAPLRMQGMRLPTQRLGTLAYLLQTAMQLFIKSQLLTPVAQWGP